MCEKIVFPNRAEVIYAPTNQPRLGFFWDLEPKLAFVPELIFHNVFNFYSLVSASFSSAFIGVNPRIKKYVFAGIKRKSILFSIKSLVLLIALALIFVLLTSTVSATVNAPWKREAVETGTSGDRDCGKIGDADNDGDNEIISGSVGYIDMHEWNGATWSRTIIDDTLGTVVVKDVVIADVDNTGRNKIAAALSNNTIFLYNWTGSMWECSVVSTAVDDDEGAGAANAILDLSVGNADNLGGNKIVAGTDSSEAVMFKWTGSSWSRTEICDRGSQPPPSPLPNVDVSDCDNDGAIEVVVCREKDAYAYYYNSGTWDVESTASIKEVALNGCVGDADNTGCNKIVVSTNSNDIYMYNWTGSWTETTVTSGSVTDIFDIKIGDVYNDGTNRIVAGDENDDVIIYTWNTGTSSWDSFTVDDAAGGEVLEVTSGDADNDGLNEIVVGTGGTGDDIFMYEAPTIISCNAAGNEKNQFAPKETVYVKGDALDASTDYKIWIQLDPVSEGESIVEAEDPSTTKGDDVTTDAQGDFPATPIWSIPEGAAVTNTEYDIVVDNQVSGVGTYNAADDGLDSASVAGIVAPVPEASSLVLLPSGLVLISVYFVYGRRKKE